MHHEEISSAHRNEVGKIKAIKELFRVGKSVEEIVERVREILDGERVHGLPWSAVIGIIQRTLDWDVHNNAPLCLQNFAGRSGVEECWRKLDLWMSDQYISGVEQGKFADLKQIEQDYNKQTSANVGEENEIEEDLKDLARVDYPTGRLIREIGEAFPRRAYRQLQNLKTESRHWGQRKLLMNEIEFLAEYGEDGDTVVYVGAAPGNHIKFLSEELFTELKFILIDPAPFHIKSSNRITLINSLFDDDMCRSFASNSSQILFISDIRRSFKCEQLILQDMLDQQKWHEILSTKASMFKFRLPWFPGQTEYLSGRLFTQPYANETSTETRMIVTDKTKRLWDHYEYSEKCFFFNSVIRQKDHFHGVEGCGLDIQSYDSAVEVEILRKYIRRNFMEDQNHLIAKLSARITFAIGGAKSREWIRNMSENVIESVQSEMQQKSQRKRKRGHK
jgi:23S rRNA U2552 (ribose-2'-O)-methylase RlmE/FtsJ